MSDELAALREEIAALRREIELLRADRTIHHYHHQAAPAPFVTPNAFVTPSPSPSVVPQPQWPWTITCGGMAARTDVMCYNGDGGTAE